MDKDFERFAGGPNQPTAHRFHVTLSPQLLIKLNRRAYEHLGRPAAVYLYYSRARDTIGVEPTSPRFQQAFPVLPNRTGWRINAAPFCRHFKISTDDTLKFVAPEMEGQSLMLKLGATVSVARQKKRPKRS